MDDDGLTPVGAFDALKNDTGLKGGCPAVLNSRRLGKVGYLGRGQHGQRVNMELVVI